MDRIRFGVHIPSTSDISFRTLSSYAERCEAAGFDSVWVADHILESRGQGLYEPLTLLAALSGSTSRIRLGTAVLIASLRNPVILADTIGTLQEICHNRFVLGVGVGWDKNEFQNLGVDYTRRGETTDEELEVVTKLLKKERLTHRGKHFRVTGASIASRPRKIPPVWIGGNSLAAVKRASRYDAWFPTDPTTEEIEKGGRLLVGMSKGGPPLIAAHIYLIVKESSTEAYKSAEFLSEMTGEPLSKVREWAIIGDLNEAERRTNDYVSAGVRYFVFSLPNTDKYLRTINYAARLVERLENLV